MSRPPAARKTTGARRPRRHHASIETYRRSTVESVIQCNAYEGDRSLEAGAGTAFHTAVKAYWLHCQARREESDLSAIVPIARRAFLTPEVGLHPDLLDDLVELFDHFARSHLAELDTLLRLEDTIEADPGLTNPITGAAIRFTGTPDRLDRLDGGDPDDDPTWVAIGDYKTNRAVVNNMFQGRFYALLVFLTMGTVDRVTTRFDYVRFPHVRGLRQAGAQNGVIEIDYWREEVEDGWLGEWWETIKLLFLEKLTAPVEPQGCAACEYCRKRTTCGGVLTPYTGTPITVEEAHALYRDWLRAKQVERTRWKALEGFFRITGTPAQHWEGDDVGFQRPREPRLVVTDPLAVVTHMEALGMDGRGALYTAIDKRKVPAAIHPSLVEVGAARREPGDLAFKRRRHQEAQNEGEGRLLDRLQEAEQDREADPDDPSDPDEEGGG